MAGDTPELDLTELTEWPAAYEDVGISGSFGPNVAARMPDDFVDYVFVERLLPGAGMADSECDRWRQRSYDTQEFARHLEACAGDGQLLSSADITRFDDCASEYEATDWRVQFLAFKRRGGWQNVADVEVRKVQEALGTSTMELSDVIESVSPDEGSFIRIMTEEKFATSRINEIRSPILSIFPDALFARPTLY
jgi:hypothetical protein